MPYAYIGTAPSLRLFPGSEIKDFIGSLPLSPWAYDSEVSLNKIIYN